MKQNKECLSSKMTYKYMDNWLYKCAKEFSEKRVVISINGAEIIGYSYRIKELWLLIHHAIHKHKI